MPIKVLLALSTQRNKASTYFVPDFCKCPNGESQPKNHAGSLGNDPHHIKWKRRLILRAAKGKTFHTMYNGFTVVLNWRQAMANSLRCKWHPFPASEERNTVSTEIELCLNSDYPTLSTCKLKVIHMWAMIANQILLDCNSHKPSPLTARASRKHRQKRYPDDLSCLPHKQQDCQILSQWFGAERQKLCRVQWKAGHITPEF